MSQISIEEAQARLGDLIGGLVPGEPVVITRGDQPVAQLTALPPKPTPQFGRCRGMLTVVSDDDEHLKDWVEYMP